MKRFVFLRSTLFLFSLLLLLAATLAPLHAAPSPAGIGAMSDRVKQEIPKEIDLRTRREMASALKQLDSLLPAPGNCGSKAINSLTLNTETYVVRGTATIAACHSWGKYRCPTFRDPNRKCEARATKNATATFAYNLETNRLSGNLNLGKLKLCSPVSAFKGCIALAEIKIDVERLQRAMEGDVVAALELIPTPKAIRTVTRNEYDRIRQSKWDQYGRDNVYFASRGFVNWASAAKSVQWAGELIATSGAAGSAIMAEVTSESSKESAALTKWLQAKGVREASRMAKDLLSGKTRNYPYIALKWQSIKYESKRRIGGVDVTPWIPIRHGAFYFVWQAKKSASQLTSDLNDDYMFPNSSSQLAENPDGDDTFSDGDSTSSNTPEQSPSSDSVCPVDVCVTNIAISDAPKRNRDVTFTATFVNNTDGPRNYNWLIVLFDPAKRPPFNGFGESPHNRITIPAGVSTQSVTYKAVTGPGPCMKLYARAGIHISASEKPEFPGSDGQPLSKSFEVC